ncbi:MAG: 30S ribosomal protein S1 [Rickettsiales bacterium]|nr:30S ribosomal protein S1 [Rickettsiales bacterium]
MNTESYKPTHESNGNNHEVPNVGDFAKLFDNLNKMQDKKEGAVVKGIITSMDKESVTVDIGMKDEGRIPIREFVQSGKIQDVKIGEEIDVYIQSYENRYGNLVLSREKAVKEIGWKFLREAMTNKTPVDGIIVGRVKGGLMVDLKGIIAFLPGSQVDVRPIKDISPLIGVEQPFIVLKIDDQQGNIIVSRKAILEESRKEEKQELLSQIKVGQELEGIVKNVTNYGGFIDLGNNIDGLLHLTDIAWNRIAHPSEVLSIGQKVKVKVIKYDKETSRISLGMKQLEKNPWEGLAEKYPVGTKMKGKITSIADYGIFVELEPGVEGLVYLSELSWVKPNVHPNKLFKEGQEVEFVILDVDIEKHRISLGIKQCTDSIWKDIEDKYPVSTVIEGKVASILKTGIVVSFGENLEGVVHSSDISWTEAPKKAMQKYNVGDDIKAVVLTIDLEKSRISLGIKHLELDPFEETFKDIKRGSVVTCTVKSVANSGLTVEISKDIETFISRSDLSSDKMEQRPDRFSVGDRIDAKVVKLDKLNRNITLSIRALEIDEQKQKISEYGSVSSGASLGDILGKAINIADEDVNKNSKSSKKEPSSTKTSKPKKSKTIEESNKETKSKVSSETDSKETEDTNAKTNKTKEENKSDSDKSKK